MSKVRHVLGISGGKDSADLAIYMKQKYPNLDIEYYTSDTGKELKETYDLIDKLENYLQKKIIKLKAFKNSTEAPFDHKLKTLNGFLPSQQFRWCTKTLKLMPFEDFVGNDPVISYVGIRGDENRDGYISTKSNIQAIFPFRKNIWSEEIIKLVLANQNINRFLEILNKFDFGEKKVAFEKIANYELTSLYSLSDKLNQVLDIGVKEFNKIVFEFLKSTKYPVSLLESYDLIDNEDVLVRKDIFNLLENSGVGVPAYYKPIDFSINGLKSSYSRSRSGCFFCFYQQRIEWVWLFEQHPEKFKEAMEYEKEGYTWNQNESLAELSQPERIASIKEEYIKRQNRTKIVSPYLIDNITDAEEDGCLSCFL